ncbi:MAG: glyoxalase [Candidatus Abyssobacteria bacterium SURF_17]|uniref:Glyoxalase n=1 Tax=Candidatus Abyssobacteria bacterium SURF_17 TaxID=2093361 RepID=A0A419EYT4_9BACT|nr:MAG: glyoxalase [Candidatus Abyssubacteria bacterium SURF_17]
MGAKALNHVAIVVDDIEKANQFYGRLLRLRQLERPPEVIAGGPGAWYKLGNRQLHIFVGPGARETSIRHFGLVVEGMDTLVERLRAAGFELEDAFSFGEFKRRKFVRDPFGNLIELMSQE